MIRDLFEHEVDHLWRRLARAADGRSEQLASLWSREGDPRVTRLIQAAGYAFARVRERLEDDQPEIAHALIASTLPEALRATPAATVVRTSDERHARVVTTTLERRVLAARHREGVPCLFETCWPVVTAPITLTHAEVRAREAGTQILTIRFAAYPGRSLRDTIPGELRLFAETADPMLALDVVHALCESRAPVRARAFDGGGRELATSDSSGVAVRWTALRPEASPLVRAPSDRFASSTVLRQLFSFPEVFGFFDLEGLRNLPLPEETCAIELSLRLAAPVADRALDARFHLGCTPAVNAWEAQTVPLPMRDLGPCGTLTVADRPPSEILHVIDARIIPDRDPNMTVPVRCWETWRGQPYLDDEVYLRVTRRAPLGNEPTELRAVLLRPSGVGQLPSGLLRATVLASDGHRAAGLLPGDIAQRSDSAQTTNITRVTPAHPPPLSAQAPWRLSAYARMPVVGFGQASSLASYLDLHAPPGARRAPPRGANPAAGGVHSARCTRVNRVTGDEVWHGDQVDIALDEQALGGAGATWVVGELLARAVAERGDLLRYTRTRTLDARGTVRFDYGVRQGDRLPPPFG